jgi:hypothetical protein
MSRLKNALIAVTVAVGGVVVSIPSTSQEVKKANAAPTIALQTLSCSDAAFNCMGALSTIVDSVGNIFVVSSPSFVSQANTTFLTRIENSGTVSAPQYLPANVTRIALPGVPVQLNADRFGNVWWGYRTTPQNAIWRIRSNERLTTHAALTSYVLDPNTNYINHGLAIDQSTGDIYPITVYAGQARFHVKKITRNADATYSVGSTFVLTGAGSHFEPAYKQGWSGNAAFVDADRKVWYLLKTNAAFCSTTSPYANYMVTDMSTLSAVVAPCQPANSRMQNFSVIDQSGNIFAGNQAASSLMVKPASEILGSSANLPTEIPIGFEADKGAAAPNGDIWAMNRACGGTINIAVVSPSDSTFRVHASTSTPGNLSCNNGLTAMFHPSVDSNSNFFIPTNSSIIIASTTHVPALSAPTSVNVVATSATAKSLDVSWATVPNSSSYKVRIYNSAGTTLLGTKSGVSGNSTTVDASIYAAIADNTDYKITVQAVGDSTNYDNSSESNQVLATTNINAVAPTISSHPVSANRTTGQSASFTVSAAVSDSGTLSYLWKKDGVVISGEVAATLTLNSVATSDAGSYTAVVTNTISNGVATSSTSTTATLTVAGALSMTTPTTGLVGTVDSSYSLSIPTTGGRATFAYVLNGTLMDDLSFSTSTGTISGTPTVAGSSTVSVTVTDANGATASTSSFTISVGYASTTVNLSLANTSPQYRISNTITATTSRAGTVNFKLDGSSIAGCGSVLVASTTATCAWVPVDLGAATLSAEFTPTTSTAYSSSTTSLSTSVSARAITVTPTAGQSKAFGDSEPLISYTITSGSLYGLDTLTGALSRVSGEDAGTYAITAGNLYNANYVITLAPANFVITQIAQDAVLLTTTNGVYATGLTLGASGGSGSGGYSFAVTSAGTAGCSIASGVLNATSPGTCTVTATRAASTNYLVASSGATSITIAKATQSVVSLTSTSGTFNTNIALTASGGTGSGGYSFSVSDTGTAGCSLAMGPSLTSTLAGSCTVTVTRAGDTYYEPRSSVATLVTFAKDTQNTLTLLDTSGDLYSGITLSVSGGSGTGAVSYSVTSGSASCSLTSGIVSARFAGTCSLTTTKAADVNYFQKQITNTLTFVKATQASLQLTSTSGSYGTPITLSSTGGSGSGSVSYAVSDNGSASCAVSGTQLTFTSAGSCKVTATRDADNIFDGRSSASTTITIDRANQTPLSVATSTGDLLTGIILAVTGGGGTGVVSTTVTSGIANCTLAAGVVTARNFGTCSLSISKAGDTNFFSASGTVTLTFAKALPVMGTVSSPTSSALGTGITLVYTGGTGNGTVMYTLVSPGTAGCSITNGVLNATSGGKCTVTITKQGDDTYADQVMTTEFTFVDNSIASTTTTTIAKATAVGVVATTTSTTTSTTSTTSTLPVKQVVPPSLVNTESAAGAATIGGKVTRAKTTRVNNQLVFSAGGFTVTLAGVNPDGTVIPLSAEGILEVRRGDMFRLDAQGFAPNSSVDIWMFSKTIYLGKIKVGTDGLVKSTFKVPKSVADGLHHLVMVGVDKADKEAKFEVGMNVGVPPKQWWYSRILIAIPISIAVFFGFWLPTSASRRRRRIRA